MGRKEKQLERLKGIPKDFTFDEARSLLETCGYTISNSGKTSGSRVKFYLGKKIFTMHKPHPRKELLEYQVKALLLELKEEGFMSNTLEYMGYIGSVEYSATDEVFFGRIVGITDHITYDGDSVQSLKQCFEEAVEDYIECCAEVGKEPEKSYNGKLDILVSPDLHRRLIGFSIQHNQPVNKTVEEALLRFVL